jgi:hypothetical protein
LSVITIAFGVFLIACLVILVISEFENKKGTGKIRSFSFYYELIAQSRIGYSVIFHLRL